MFVTKPISCSLGLGIITLSNQAWVRGQVRSASGPVSRRRHGRPRRGGLRRIDAVPSLGMGRTIVQPHGVINCAT
jgi:hypothetical protein